VMVPVILAAAKSSGAVLDARGLSDAYNWLALLVVYDIVFFVVSILTFDFVVEE
jgi:ABC-type transport system involved in cytochrome c biogenesis permease component